MSHDQLVLMPLMSMLQAVRIAVMAEVVTLTSCVYICQSHPEVDKLSKKLKKKHSVNIVMSAMTKDSMMIVT